MVGGTASESKDALASHHSASYFMNDISLPAESINTNKERNTDPKRSSSVPETYAPKNGEIRLLCSKSAQSAKVDL